MPSGDFRRPPQLWEQKIANMVAVSNVGAVAGGGTVEVGSDLPPGNGGGGGAEPPEVIPTPTAFGTPSTPTLTGGVQSIMVTWDGLNSSGGLYPYSSAVVEVHMSTSTGFTPDATTLKGELRYPGNLTITGLTAATTYYFKLRGRDAQGNYSTASAQASGQTGLTQTNDYGTATINSGAVSFDARAIGGITTTVGTSTPTSPKTGDIWLDTTGGSTTHKRWDGSSWVTQAWGSSSLSANCITATQIAAGAVTAGAIAADAVTAAKIKADAIDGKTITGATIRTSATAGTATAPRAGLVIDTSGLRGYNSAGSETININASTGAVTISGYQPAGSYLTSADVGSGGSTTIDGGRITTGTISASRIDTAILRATDVGSGGSTTISGDRITTGTITARKFQTSTSGTRIVLADASNTYGVDSIAFFGAGAHLYPDATLGLVLSGKLWISSSLYVNGVSTFQGNATASGNLTVDGTFDANGGVTLAASGANAAVRVATGGQVYSYGINDNTTTNAANVRCGASAQLLLSTSTIRVKDELTPLTNDLAGVPSEKLATFPASVDPYDVLTLTPTEFRSLAPADADARNLGFIAEDVAAKFPWAANWDEDGIPSAVEDRPILAALLAVVQQQQQTIENLTARVEALEAN